MVNGTRVEERSYWKNERFFLTLDELDHLFCELSYWVDLFVILILVDLQRLSFHVSIPAVSDFTPVLVVPHSLVPFGPIEVFFSLNFIIPTNQARD